MSETMLNQNLVGLNPSGSQNTRTQEIRRCSKVVYYTFGTNRHRDRVSTIALCRTDRKTYTLMTCASSIVFVHGFGGHYTDTWTSEGVYWPRDLLKSKLERARIISFAYDADISQFLPQDEDSISSCASELLTNLIRLRADESQVRREFSSLDKHDFICL